MEDSYSVVVFLDGVFGWCSRPVGLPYGEGVRLSAALVGFSGTLHVAALLPSGCPGYLSTSRGKASA